MKLRQSAALRKQHHLLMLEAARGALALSTPGEDGVNVHIFAAAYRQKVPRRGTHGSNDARGNYTRDGKVQTNEVLLPWWGKRNYVAANPCIRLDLSELVAYDIDHGFEGLSDAEMIEKAERFGLLQTYTIRTGRENGGATFIYHGRRGTSNTKDHEGYVADVRGRYGFKVKLGENGPEKIPGLVYAESELFGGVSGDVIHHGHIAAAGSLHKTGNFYRCINHTSFTALSALPTFWRDYANKRKERAASAFDLNWLKRAEAETEMGQTLKKLHTAMMDQRDYLTRHRELVAKGKEIEIPYEAQYPRTRRIELLQRDAGRWRAMGMDAEVIRVCLDLRALRTCCKEDRTFLLTHAHELDYLAGLTEVWPGGSRFIKTIKIPTTGTPGGTPGSGIIVTSPPARHTLLVKAMMGFPTRISSVAGYDAFEKALEGTEFTINRNSTSGQRAAKAIRLACGYRVVRTGGTTYWVKMSKSRRP